MLQNALLAGASQQTPLGELTTPVVSCTVQATTKQQSATTPSLPVPSTSHNPLNPDDSTETTMSAIQSVEEPAKKTKKSSLFGSFKRASVSTEVNSEDQLTNYLLAINEAGFDPDRAPNS